MVISPDFVLPPSLLLAPLSWPLETAPQALTPSTSTAAPTPARYFVVRRLLTVGTSLRCGVRRPRRRRLAGARTATARVEPAGMGWCVVIGEREGVLSCRRAADRPSRCGRCSRRRHRLRHGG